MSGSVDRRPLPDAASRERIGTALDETLFVEAGAGSGKTTELVARVCALVIAGVPMRRIAAITFTNKAAAELRDRVRVGLEAARVEALDDGKGALAERIRVALDELDAAAVGTLHSFAGRILSEHPVQAGIPPLITTRDEVGSQVAFERRWVEIRSRLLTDPSIAGTLQQLLDLGVKLDAVRSLVGLLEKDWDLVQERMSTPTPGVDVPVDVSGLLIQAAAVLDLRDQCVDDADKLLGKLAVVEEWAGEVRRADEHDVLFRLGGLPKVGNLGKAGSWGCPVADVRRAVADLAESAQALHDAAVDRLVRRLVGWLATQVLAAADERRAAGQLEFHDLLVLARAMLRDPVHGTGVRAALQRRYPRLLLDEFQDTDPIQVELAVRIAAGADPGSGAADWHDIAVPPGSLFVVGDPKQSIYRFRRADIAAYLDTRDHLGGTVDLVTNFRATKPLLDWVNAVFGELVQESRGEQPAYVPLAHDPNRPPWDPTDATLGPAVTVLGADAHDPKTCAEELRVREANDVAAAIAAMLQRGWRRDVRRRGLDGSFGWTHEPVRPRDVCILVPTRRSLPQLEDALDAAGIPYRTDISAQVYSSPEIRDLLTAVRAIDDPSDGLALVATLRSQLFGCGDDDLFVWHRAGGRWSLFADVPASLTPDHPVAEAIAWLHDLARRVAGLAPSEVLAALVDDRRALEVVIEPRAARPRHREAWRRIRFVIDQARAWSEAEHGSLREYLAWAARQAEDDARVEEEVLPETDVDAVRIMTVHTAKGLQFPVVVLSGMTSPAGGGTGPILLWQGTGWEARLLRGVATLGLDAARQRDAELDRLERIRLLYVACTRAESHLVVSLHRPSRSGASAVPRTGAEIVAPAALSGVADGLQDLFATPDVLPVMDAAPPVVPAPAPTRSEWTARHDAATSASAVRAAVSATDAAKGGDVTLPSIVVEGLDKKPRDLELPPWAKGRYGTAVGRAVHASLQSLDLADPRDVADVAAAFALAESVPEHTDVVEALVHSALACDVVRRAAGQRHWKETYVGSVIDGILIEGYVDLLYQEDDGTLVVVDYKTDAELGAGSLHAYGMQVALYARAVTDATGIEVSRRVLVACRPSGAREVAV